MARPPAMPCRLGREQALVGLVFVEGLKMVVKDGIDYRKATAVGLAFWIGVGFQNQAIFPGLLDGAWAALLGNGMITGGFVAILMTAFMELTGPRRRRLGAELSISSLPKVDAFIREFASKMGWNHKSTERLRSVGEETLLSLLQQDNDASDEGRALDHCCPFR